MKADPRFTGLPRTFWANVRSISQEVGYTERGANAIKIPTLAAIRKKFDVLGLSVTHIATPDDSLTEFGQGLLDYFAYRAEVLNSDVQGWLMKKYEAEHEFEKLRERFTPICPLPMNKQKNDKRNHAFLTGMVNMLIEANIQGAPCDFDPRSLTTITRDAMPLRTLSRRVDGAFPSAIDPIAIWEIKEYYYTTTFGSRVADGVYETLLDGMELAELEIETARKIQHVLILDDHFTWWQCGRSYLCRIIDMLHMAYVDEVIFGRETLTRIPELAREWRAVYDRQAI